MREARRWEWMSGCAIGVAVGVNQPFSWPVALLLVAAVFCALMAEREACR